MLPTPAAAFSRPILGTEKVNSVSVTDLIVVMDGLAEGVGCVKDHM